MCREIHCELYDLSIIYIIIGKIMIYSFRGNVILICHFLLWIKIKHELCINIVRRPDSIKFSSYKSIIALLGTCCV